MIRASSRDDQVLDDFDDVFEKDEQAFQEPDEEDQAPLGSDREVQCGKLPVDSDALGTDAGHFSGSESGSSQAVGRIVSGGGVVVPDDPSKCSKKELENLVLAYKDMLNNSCRETQRITAELQCLINLVKG